MLDTRQRSPRLEAAAVDVPAPRRAPERRSWDAGRTRVHRVTGQALPERAAASRARQVLVSLTVDLALLGALAALLGLAVGPHTGEYRTLTMLTGSMHPQFPAGSVIVVTPQPVSELRVGQVITFHAPTPDHRVVTHRVTHIDRGAAKPVVKTKGDANAGPDPWAATIEEPVVWRARFAVPLLGDAIIALRQPQVQLALTKVLPGALVCWLLWSVWRPERTS